MRARAVHPEAHPEPDAGAVGGPDGGDPRRQATRERRQEEITRYIALHCISFLAAAADDDQEDEVTWHGIFGGKKVSSCESLFSARLNGADANSERTRSESWPVLIAPRRGTQNVCAATNLLTCRAVMHPSPRRP